MQGTRARTIVEVAGLAAVLLLAGCGRHGTPAPAAEPRPMTEPLGCGDRRNAGGFDAAPARLTLTATGELVTVALTPTVVVVEPCGGRPATAALFAPDPPCPDFRPSSLDARARPVSRPCRPTGPRVDRKGSGHP